ncbi:MAG: histidine--tRNA ligase [Tannerellaceae bacterium]|jgi:histidyl-tRNA synthetase|nr:histidine--tRNA ligase [Tannerellaceae bacterium]
MQKASIPKGTRDFSPEEMGRRNYIFDTLREAFRLWGFRQIETPSMENLSTLMGKYGCEGDKLLFKILNSGDYLKEISQEDLEKREAVKLLPQLSKKGLRYDLTVPFARYVVQHKNELRFPFRRYQMQPVWRADNPQRGRYREFYQCDADIIGSSSLMNEVELVQLIDRVFRRLGIRVVIKLNHRKILAGLAEMTGYADRLVDLTTAIDKLDKMGIEKVKAELRAQGFEEQAIGMLLPLLELKGTNTDKLERLEGMLPASRAGQEGIKEMRFILKQLSLVPLEATLELDPSLARGLDYYTGTIFEVKAVDVAMGSITGGGRYDNLTGIFGMPGVSGVGISFGAERIYDVLNQLNGYPAETLRQTEVLFLYGGEKELMRILPYIAELREGGVSAELYPDAVSYKKQLEYANAAKIPRVAILGETEWEGEKISLKDMRTGEQRLVTFEELKQCL